MHGGVRAPRPPLDPEQPVPESVPWLQEIADRLPDLVAVTRAGGETTYLNAAGRRLLGVRPDEIAALRLHDLYAPDELHAITADALPACLRDGTWTGRTAMVDRSGWEIPVLLTLNAHRDGAGRLEAISLVARDLSGLEDEVRERRASEGLYRSLISAAPEIIMLLDPYGRTLYTNPTMERLFGYTQEEALHLDNWSQLHPEDVQAAQDALEHLLEHPRDPVHLRLRSRHKDGHYVPFELVATAHLDDPALRGILLYGRPLHEAQGDADLRSALGDLKARQTERTLHLDRVAHDMKQPLSPIMLQVHLLRHLAGEDGSRARRSLQIIEENALRLERFIDDFRDLTQLERDALSIEVETVDLGARVASVVASLFAEANRRGIGLQRVTFSTFPIQADPGRVDQVLFNLIQNAMKFTPEGGRIRVVVRRKDAEAVCTVEDTGRGLEGDEPERVFQPFVQVHGPGESSEKGTGLGLAICRGIIERHGGRIWAESEGFGKGSRFSFALPLALSDTSTE